MTSQELNLSQLPNFASLLASRLKPGMAVLLHGPLGAGKTTLTRMLIQALTQEAVEVQSPTFPICLTYDSPRGTIWHYDLYRMPDNTPLDDLGWNEARCDGIAIVEWPERARAHDLTPPLLHITLSATDHDEVRSVRIEEVTA